MLVNMLMPFTMLCRWGLHGSAPSKAQAVAAACVLAAVVLSAGLRLIESLTRDNIGCSAIHCWRR
jgi:hypothetical protein